MLRRMFLVLATAAITTTAFTNVGDGNTSGNTGGSTNNGNSSSTELWVSGQDGHTYGMFAFNESTGTTFGPSKCKRTVMNILSITLDAYQCVPDEMDPAICTVHTGGPAFWNGKPGFLSLDIFRVPGLPDILHVVVMDVHERVAYDRYSISDRKFMIIMDQGP
jgi:hypothetical protein